jgi:hypothetical protein
MIIIPKIRKFNRGRPTRSFTSVGNSSATWIQSIWTRLRPSWANRHGRSNAGVPLDTDHPSSWTVRSSVPAHVPNTLMCLGGPVRDTLFWVKNAQIKPPVPTSSQALP